MNCQQAQQLMQDYVDELLDSAQAEALAGHISHCHDCAEKLEQQKYQQEQYQQQLRRLLTNAPVPPPSAGFVDRALRAAVSKSRQHADSHAEVRHRVSHRQGFIKGFGSALVAGLVLWTVVGVFPTPNKDSDSTTRQVASHQASNQEDSAIRVSLLEPTNITLAFYAAQAVQDATITISLSDNIELVGYQNQQVLEWKTNLVAGDNMLTLPIKALTRQRGKVVAQVSHKNLIKSIEFELDVKNLSDANKPGISNYNFITTPAA